MLDLEQAVFNISTFTFQCWPRCTVQTFNSWHAAILGTPHGWDVFKGTKNLKPLGPGQ